MCHLTTRGRRTGAERTVALLYATAGGTLVVAESNWGRRARPAWALNLDASPHARITVAGRSRHVTARRATAAEETRWWPLLVEIWPGWQGYRRRAGRRIALYALEPSPDPASQARRA